MLARDVEVPARIRGRVLMALRNAHAVDLGADHGAVGDVEILQRTRCGVVGAPAVLVEEMVAEVLPAQEFKVHREECGVIDAVDVAKVIVELQAVEQRRPVRQTEDVVGKQIGVPVDDPAIGDAFGE